MKFELPHNVQEAIERTIERNTQRDPEFLSRFGRWQRPSFAPKYDLDRMKHLIRWSPFEKGIIDAAPFINSLQKFDRVIAGEIAKFTAEEVHGKHATDKVLNTFKLQFLRRLSEVGF